MWILDYRHDALTSIFKALTFTGDATFFLLIFTVGYWIWDRQIFARATLVLLIAVLVNSILKAIFQVPRPDASLFLVEAHGWSFPSGHAMAAAALWPWLAWESRKRWAMPLAVGLALGVAASRVYLGVHTVRDVAWGLLFGALLLIPAQLWKSSPPNFWTRLGATAQTLYLTVAVFLILFLCPVYDGDTTGAKVGGALITLWLGLSWDRRRGAILPSGLWRKIAAAAIGLAGTFAIRIFAKLPLDALGPAPLGLDPLIASDFVRYGLIGLWIAALAPLTFSLLRLVPGSQNQDRIPGSQSQDGIP